MTAAQNIIGPKIKAIRRDKGLTQSDLAARCQLLGWDIGENGITKIETQIRCVVDAELLCLAQALHVFPQELLPDPSVMKKTLKQHYAKRDGS
ncbi:helix-turn-helix transcriptional regulator [Phragmitibacter flavus]|uniref:Helix-turn-helix transcriptional regulator n=1 Tax=Phragmitibacter flavus TaxID=2576071 RepID=A0A5R8KHE3_9BACT|nr:helix-turn-helix transcriptional regulator [Phragmitibacter flavus]TLD71660.1 helix-turn-helix transcriptional regulator [Phragmitibacter flavus]